jgi:salicylate hydroxylase
LRCRAAAGTQFFRSPSGLTFVSHDADNVGRIRAEIKGEGGVVRRPSILLIGAGIGGVAAAKALHERGCEVTIVEQAAQSGEVGAGLQIGPNGVKVLRALGLGAELLAIASEVNHIVTLDWRHGNVLSQDTMGAAAREKFAAPYLTVHRADLHRLLLGSIPEAQIAFGRRCIGVSSSARGTVARFADGGEIEADAIVGCDGIHSVVRDSLYGKDKPLFTKQLFWRGTVEMERVAPLVAGRFKGAFGIGDNLSWLSPRTGRVLCYPMSRGRVLNVAAGNLTERWTSESWLTPALRDDVLAAYRDWDETLQTILRGVDAWFCQGVFDRDPLPRWTTDAVTLLGDAAHPMMPTLAQGAVMALEDAFVLGRSLAENMGEPRLGLAAYEARRKPRTDRAQLQARAQYRANLTSPPPPRMDRDWMFSFDATAAA